MGRKNAFRLHKSKFSTIHFGFYPALITIFNIYGINFTGLDSNDGCNCISLVLIFHWNSWNFHVNLANRNKKEVNNWLHLFRLVIYVWLPALNINNVLSFKVPSIFLFLGSEYEWISASRQFSISNYQCISCILPLYLCSLMNYLLIKKRVLKGKVTGYSLLIVSFTFNNMFSSYCNLSICSLASWMNHIFIEYIKEK